MLGSPPRVPKDTAIQSIVLLLRIAILGQCLGNACWCAGVVGWFSGSGDSPLFSLMVGPTDHWGLGMGESSALAFHRFLAMFWFAAAIVVAVRPMAWMLASVATLQALGTFAMVWTLDGYQPAPGWLPVGVASLFPLATQAARVVAPIALGMLLFQRSLRSTQRAMRWMTGAIALTFAAHGVEAWQHNPAFVDMLIVALRRLFGWEMSQTVAETHLTIIGMVDLLLATMALWACWPGVAYYMATWGLLTAGVRIVVDGGMTGWVGFATRLAHVALPWALAIYWREFVATRTTSIDESVQQGEAIA